MKDPFIISSIIMSIVFLFLLIYNQKLKSKIIKISFLILSLIFLILILVCDNNYIYDLLRLLINYLWYPSYLMFVSTILFINIIFISTLLNKNNNMINKIIDYSLFCICFASYITYLRLDVDLSLVTSLYSSNALLIRRIISITFFAWLILKIVFKILKRGKNEK